MGAHRLRLVTKRRSSTEPGTESERGNRISPKGCPSCIRRHGLGSVGHDVSQPRWSLFDGTSRNAIVSWRRHGGTMGGGDAQSWSNERHLKVMGNVLVESSRNDCLPYSLLGLCASIESSFISSFTAKSDRISSLPPPTTITLTSRLTCSMRAPLPVLAYPAPPMIC